jgi:hypothetical protein
MLFKTINNEALQNSSDELTQEKHVAFCIRQTT